MASVIANALSKGFTARTILNQITKKFPQYANVINTAMIAGYSADNILRYLTKSKSNDPDQFLTEREKYHKNISTSKRNAALQGLGLLGTAGALTAGGVALASRGRAIQPSAILPPIRQQAQGRGVTPVPIRPKGLPPPSQRRIPPSSQSPMLPAPIIPPSPMGGAPAQPTPPPSMQPLAPQPMVQRDIMKSVNLIKSLKEDPRFEMAIRNSKDPLTGSLILRSVMPKDKLALFDKSPQGLEGAIEDYMSYLSQQPKVKTPQTEQPQITPEKPQQESVIPMQEQMIPKEQEIEKIPLEIKPEIKAQITPEKPIIQPEISGNLAILPKGEIGEVQEIKKGIAKINIDGKIKNVKLSDIKNEPGDVEQAVRHIVNSIPENMKSTALQSMVHIPGLNILITQFYDGKFAWYKDVPEDIYRSIALGTYEPKGEAKTGIGEYKPGVMDSRGAGFHSEIKINPKYSKENKGITWGYATNEYNLLHGIQESLHKISKEKYDKEGNLIVPKKRKKSSID